MRAQYQARWISKKRIESLRKSGALCRRMLVDSIRGFIVIEPVGRRLGDGDVLALDVASYELDPAWCLDSRLKIAEARRLLGIESISRREDLSKSRSLPKNRRGNVYQTA